MENLRSFTGLFQMLLVLGFGGNLLVGFQIAVVGFPSEFIKAFINETSSSSSSSSSSSGRTPAPRAQTLLFLWSLVVSIFGIGGLLGSLASGCLALRFGKKRTLLGNDLLVLLASFLLAFSQSAASFPMLLLGRFLFGVGSGLSMAVHPQYAGEVSPKRLRGFANATSGFFWSFGKSLGQILGLRELLGSQGSWPFLLSFAGVAAFAQLLTLPFFPESPPFLLIRKKDEEGCRQALQRLWGPGAHEESLAELKAEASPDPPLSPLALLRDPALRPQVRILAASVLTLQLCGINAVYFYTSDVFRTLGFKEDLIPYVSLGVGFCELASAVLCALTIDHFGRRVLLWGGCGAMAATLGLLTLALGLQDRLPWASCASAALVFLFVVAFGLGPNGAAMSVMMEIFPHSSRPSAFVIGGCLNWAGLFLIGITFPFAVGALGPFVFLIFAVAMAAAGTFFFLFLPETKGKSLAEIDAEFKAEPRPRSKMAAVFQKGFRKDPSPYENF